MSDFKLPDVGEGISEAELLEWHVAVGDAVDEDQVVASVNTDKVSFELPSPRSGTIEELCWSEGDIVPVGAVLLRFVASLEERGAAPDRTPRSDQVVAASSDGSTPKVPSPSADRTQRPPAAPSTRRYAAERGVDLSSVVATGPGGRALRADVDAALAVTAGTVGEGRAVGAGVSGATGGGPDRTLEALRGVRGVVARKMLEASQTTATATSTFEVDGDGILGILEEFRASPLDGSVRLTPLAVIAKCVARALTVHPRFNATVTDDGSGIHLHRDVDLSIAVAAEEGLTVPVVRGADRLTLTELAASIHDLADRARSGRLTAADLQGGTFTVSSTGGIERLRMVSTTPIINLPQTAILWVSRIQDRPRVRDGVLEAGPVMTVSVSFDHRFIDGADVTAFMNTLSALLERPVGALA